MSTPNVFSKLIQSGDCWVWTGYVHERGYGRINRAGKHVKVHRWVYEFYRGPIPQGLTIDHLCANKLCCNPDHMDPVPSGVNVSRRWNREMTSGNTCHRGHLRTPENTYVRPSGARECAVCKRLVRAGQV